MYFKNCNNLKFFKIKVPEVDIDAQLRKLLILIFSE